MFLLVLQPVYGNDIFITCMLYCNYWKCRRFAVGSSRSSTGAAAAPAGAVDASNASLDPLNNTLSQSMEKFSPGSRRPMFLDQYTLSAVTCSAVAISGTGIEFLDLQISTACMRHLVQYHSSIWFEE